MIYHDTSLLNVGCGRKKVNPVTSNVEKVVWLSKEDLTLVFFFFSFTGMHNWSEVASGELRYFNFGEVVGIIKNKILT